MSKPTMQSSPAAFKERAVTLAVESDQSIAQTARDLGVNEHTFHTWIGTYHRGERQEKQGQDEHRYEALNRLRKENARLKEERDRRKKAAAYFAQQLPCSTPGDTSSPPRLRGVLGVSSWRSRGVATMSGATAPLGRRLQLIRSDRPRCSPLLPRGVARMARVASSLCEPRQEWWCAVAASDACCPRRGCAGKRGASAKRPQRRGRPRPWPRTRSTAR
jgi:transposase